MASPMSTFATLRALQLVIANALDDIQRVFSQHDLPGSSSPGDYPSPDSPIVSDSPGEQLARHPDAVAAASKIVAACGQMSNIVHKPYSSLWDAMMSFNLPACIRFVEHLHVPEILREAENSRRHDLASEQEVAVPLSASEADQSLTESDLLSTEVREKWASGSLPQDVTGMHVAEITKVICSYAGVDYVDSDNLAHALRLLSTHHLFRETAPDTFALTRVASLLDSGKSVKEMFSSPDTKYDEAGGIPAYVALITDEVFKSAAYLTEAWTGVQLPNQALTPNPSCGVDPGITAAPSVSSLTSNDPASGDLTAHSPSVLEHITSPKDIDIPSSSKSLATGLSAAPPDVISPPTQMEKGQDLQSAGTRTKKIAAFNLGLMTDAHFFKWMEDGGEDPLGNTGQCACTHTLREARSVRRGDGQSGPNDAPRDEQPDLFRHHRFSKSMTGTTLLEAPNAILNGFDWHSLPKGATVVDVGGGIGCTTIFLARALDGVDLRFVVQDKPAVTALGAEKLRSEWPKIYEREQVVFQSHDFFTPQPTFGPPHLAKHPAIYILRFILPDWPDERARQILINLRLASNPETRLVIADYVLPLACVDEEILEEENRGAYKETHPEAWTAQSILANVQGAKRALASPPLLPNLGKGNANAYWADGIMHVIYNGKIRTLREFCALGLSAGWRVARMTQPDAGSLFYVICEPIALPDDVQAIQQMA